MDRLTPRRIADLPPRQRQTVELRCGDRELTMHEAATAMGITYQTVKNHGTAVIRLLGVTSFNGVCRMYGEQTVIAALRAGEV